MGHESTKGPAEQVIRSTGLMVSYGTHIGFGHGFQTEWWHVISLKARGLQAQQGTLGIKLMKETGIAPTEPAGRINAEQGW